MTHLDSDNPATSRFARNGMPVMDTRLAGYFPTTGHNYSSVPTSLPTLQNVQQPHIAVEPTVLPVGCFCDEVSLGRQWPEAQTRVPLWVATPTWNSEWTEGEIKKEECRRLCWSALMLISGHTSYAAAVNWRHSDYFVMEPSNVRYLARFEVKVAHSTLSIRSYFRGSPCYFRIHKTGRIRSGRCIFVRCCSGMRVYECGAIQLSATTTGQNLRCEHGWRRRR
jgi:hypothetical protein